jgi:hypothetical protein
MLGNQRATYEAVKNLVIETSLVKRYYNSAELFTLTNLCAVRNVDARSLMPTTRQSEFSISTEWT